MDRTSSWLSKLPGLTCWDDCLAQKASPVDLMAWTEVTLNLVRMGAATKYNAYPQDKCNFEQT